MLKKILIMLLVLPILNVSIIYAGNKYQTCTKKTIQKEKKIMQNNINCEKILVVSYSRTGNTEKVAKDIATSLKADTEKIIDKKSRNGFISLIIAGKDSMFKKETKINKTEKTPQNYDLVVIGTPIWAGKMTPAIRTYLNKNKDKIKALAFFTTAGGNEVDKVTPSIEEIYGKKVTASVGFTEKELKSDNTNNYKNKIEEFTKSIKSS